MPSSLQKSKNKVLLIVLDGYGKGPNDHTNAIFLANPPTLTKLEQTVPHTLIKTDSQAVGLPANTLGGSEVGHSTIGAGRVIYQSLEMINQQIQSKEFFQKEPFLEATKIANQNNSTLHLIGMISDGGIHSHIDHLFALLDLAKQENVKKVAIHAIADGRDVPKKSVTTYLQQIQDKIDSLDLGQIVDLIGRYYAMDRDNNWDRTQQAYQLYTLGQGTPTSLNLQKLQNQYTTSVETSTSKSPTSNLPPESTDYYLQAKKFTNSPDHLITSEDSIIFFNFRTDRAKQLTDAFTLTEFNHFKTELKPLPYFVCFGDYSSTAPVVFSPVQIKNNLGEVISKAGLKQLRIAETEKYPHVTFFFNSQQKEPYKNEERILIDSPKVPSYADKPEMSAIEITEKLSQELDKQTFDFIVCNYANMDLVGHSGDIEATQKAILTVDSCLKEILKKAEQNNYSVIITGDHGNADEMIYTSGTAKGEASPSHSFNPTQCFVISPEVKNLRSSEKHMHDIAPTILKLLNIPKPSEMTGESLY